MSVIKIITSSFLLLFLVTLELPVLAIPHIAIPLAAILVRLAPIIARFSISRAALSALGLLSLGATGIAIGILIKNVIQVKQLETEILLVSMVKFFGKCHFYEIEMVEVFFPNTVTIEGHEFLITREELNGQYIFTTIFSLTGRKVDKVCFDTAKGTTITYANDEKQVMDAIIWLYAIQNNKNFDLFFC